MANVVTFVKSSETKTPAAKSRTDLEAMLKRYRASGFTVSEDYVGRTAVVAFSIPRSFQVESGEHLEVLIPLSYGEVQRRLETLTWFKGRNEPYRVAQAERVAWRHLVILTEAALMAAAIGVQTVEESLFAHAVQELPGVANKMRAIDAFATARRQLGRGR